MSGLKDFLPAPVVDIFLPIVLVLIAGRILLPILKRKLEDSGAWDQILNKLGGENLRRIQFQREISRLKKSGDVVGAAQLYEEAEWYPEAVELYLKAGDYIGAGILYEKLNHSEQAAEMYLQADDWKRAAATYAEAGHQRKAAELFEQHGQKIDAAKFYFEAGQFGRAAELYEEVSHFPQAAQAFEKMGEFVRAADNYEKHWAATSSIGGGGLIASPTERDAKVARMAGQLYEKGGAPDKAAALYRRARLSKQAAALAAREGRYDEAGEMLLKDEELEKAAEMFEKAGQRERAAGIRGEVAFRNGENALAAQEFLKGGDALRAAELFESVGDLASAAKCFEQSESLIQAANVYLRADKKEEAARLFEQGGDATTAAKLYGEIGEDAKASELFEKAERFYEAGMLAHKRQDSDRAIQLLQRIDPSDERYEAATLLVSRLFIDKNMTSLAKEKLLRVLGDRPIGPQTLEHFYCLGLVYEKLGKRTDAIETFRKIMAERYGYEDVEQRIARLSAAAEPEPVPEEAEAPPAAEEPAPPPAPPRPATAAPRIKITEELGRGLLGGTFKAIDTRNGRPVAVKILNKELLQNQETVQRFLAEAKLAKSFEHPSLVRLLGLTELMSQKAVVMEFVEGNSLASILAKHKRLTAKQALDILNNLCVALSYAHKRRLLHRDLKMTDVLVTPAGKLRLAGMGLGALRTPELGVGEGYPPPEFLAGSRPDVRCDIYSLGGLLFHGLSGIHPSESPTVDNGAPTLQKLVPTVPESLDRIILRCLAENPDARFANVAELYSAVQEVKT